ncbi:MAG: hypothetical protein WCA16_05435 [Candidatus Sulfotelmatobacter sp.]
MEALSEQPLAAESVQAVLFAEPAPQFVPRDIADDEFPPDLPVTYDWVLQPASQRSLRRALRFLAITVAVLVLAAICSFAYRLPRLIAPIALGMAVVVLVAVGFRVFSSVFGGVSPAPSCRDECHPPLNP